MDSRGQRQSLTQLLATPALLACLSQSVASTPDWSQVYPEGGETLYCQEPFDANARSIRPGEVYPLNTLLRDFDCITLRQCAEKPEFRKLSQDLHNLYPVSRQEDLDRRGTLFSDLPEDSRTENCGYRKSIQSFDPSDHAKGNIARAMLYMHTRHNIPLPGNIQIYRRWHELDPVDDEERRRNALIQSLQGNSNPFIDDPDLLRNFEP